MNSNTYNLSRPLGAQDNPFIEQTIIDPYTGQGYTYYSARGGDQSQYDTSLRQAITPQIEQSNYARQTGAAGWDAPYKAESARIQAEIARNRAAAEAYLSRGSQQQQPPPGGATQGAGAMGNSYSGYGQQPTGFANMNYGFNPLQPQGYGNQQQPYQQRADGSFMGTQYNGQYGNAANGWGGSGANRGALSNGQDEGQRSPFDSLPQAATQQSYAANGWQGGGGSQGGGGFSPTQTNTLNQYAGGSQRPNSLPYQGGQISPTSGSRQNSMSGGVALGRPNQAQFSGGSQGGGIAAPIYSPGYQGATNTDTPPMSAGGQGYVSYPGISPPGYGRGQYVQQGNTQQYQSTNQNSYSMPQQVTQQSYSYQQPPQMSQQGYSYQQQPSGGMPSVSGFQQPMSGFNAWQQAGKQQFPGIR